VRRRGGAGSRRSTRVSSASSLCTACPLLALAAGAVPARAGLQRPTAARAGQRQGLRSTEASATHRPGPRRSADARTAAGHLLTDRPPVRGSAARGHPFRAAFGRQQHQHQGSAGPTAGPLARCLRPAHPSSLHVLRRVLGPVRPSTPRGCFLLPMKIRGTGRSCRQQPRLSSPPCQAQGRTRFRTFPWRRD
jgi:hypothetical protein